MLPLTASLSGAFYPARICGNPGFKSPGDRLETGFWGCEGLEAVRFEV